MKDHLVEKNKDKIIEKPLPLPPMPPPPPPKLEMPSSIIDEPKTLLHDELNAAREAAIKIINTHTKEEALEIFLKGLVPVESSNVNAHTNVNEKKVEEDDDDVFDWEADEEY